MAINSPISIPASLFYPKKGFNLTPTRKAGTSASAEIAFSEQMMPIQLDLILSESHTLESEVSTQPIQQGSDLSIHVKKKLFTGTLTALVSNWGLNVDSFLGDYAQSVMTKNEARENRAKSVWKQLKLVMETQTLMTIVCALEVYEDVLITGLKADRNGDSGEAQEFEIKFQKLNIVELKREINTLSVVPNQKLATKKPATTASTGTKSAAKAAKQAAPPAAPVKVTPAPAQMAPVTAPAYNTVPADATSVHIAHSAGPIAQPTEPSWFQKFWNYKFPRAFK